MADDIPRKLADIGNAIKWRAEFILPSMHKNGHLDENSSSGDDEIVKEVIADNPSLAGHESGLKTNIAFLGINNYLGRKQVGKKFRYWLDEPTLMSPNRRIGTSEEMVKNWLEFNEFRIIEWHPKPSNLSYDIIAEKDGRRYYLDAKRRKSDENFLKNASREDAHIVGYAILSPEGEVYLALHDKQGKIIQP